MSMATGWHGEGPASREARRRWLRLFENGFPYFLVLPAVAGILLVILFPIVYNTWLSFHMRRLIIPRTPFVGLMNYTNVLHDPEFWGAIWVTAIWAIGSICLNFVVGLSMALLLNLKFPGKSIFRIVFLIPWATPQIVAAMNWKWLLNDQFGLINALLVRFGLLSQSVAWLADLRFALPMVILINVWKNYGFEMMAFLAALQSIPGVLYEAASIDGAGVGQRFRYVTLPLLRPIILVLIILRSIWSINSFDMVYVLTAGGPANATQLASLYVYKTAFERGMFSSSATASMMIFLVVLALAILFMRASARKGDVNAA
jgi:ABC-type sugar transport system permease subunit